MKNKAYLMGLMAMGLMSMGATTRQGRHFEPEDIEPKKKPLPNGCKEYTFYGITVVAISEKSARKKCKKLKHKNETP